MTVAEKISRIRKGNNLTQEQFAETLNVSRQTVYRWESNNIIPSNENLQRICNKFSVNMAVFYEAMPYTDNSITEVQNTSTALQSHSHKNRPFWFAILLLIILLNIVMAKSITTIHNLKNDVMVLSARLSQNEENLKNIQHILNNINKRQPRTDRYIFFDYQVLDYDRKINMVTIEIQVTPADYTGTTTARFTVDTTEGSFTADAQYADHMYTGIITTYRQRDMPLYMYLTDGGRVKSFLVDYLPDLTQEFKLNFGWTGVVGTDTIILEDGRLDTGSARVDVSVDFVMDKDNKAKIVYPVKAELEIYCGKTLLATKSFANLTDVDYYALAENKAHRLKPEHRYKYSAYLRLSEVFTNEAIKSGDVVNFRLKVTDNQGMEYEEYIKNRY